MEHLAKWSNTTSQEVRRALALINVGCFDCEHWGITLCEWQRENPEVVDTVNSLLESEGFTWEGWGWVNKTTFQFVRWVKYPDIEELYPAQAVANFQKEDPEVLTEDRYPILR